MYTYRLKLSVKKFGTKQLKVLKPTNKTLDTSVIYNLLSPPPWISQIWTYLIDPGTASCSTCSGRTGFARICSVSLLSCAWRNPSTRDWYSPSSFDEFSFFNLKIVLAWAWAVSVLRMSWNRSNYSLLNLKHLMYINHNKWHILRRSIEPFICQVLTLVSVHRSYRGQLNLLPVKFWL